MEEEELFPPRSTVVLLVGVPGDVESEGNYRDQLQGWVDLAVGSGQAAKIYVLCDDPQAVTLPGKGGGSGVVVEAEESVSRKTAVISNQLSVIRNQGLVSVLKGDRSGFVGIGQRLAGDTNALVVIAWGHGGRQGNTPVLHVRGPRITAADFRGLAQQAATRESRWVLMFRGSGAFASELAGERRQIISSEGETMFSDDPVGMPLLLKTVKEKPGLGFGDLAQELGRATEAWYADRQLARTEEPTLWVGTDKPRRLVLPAAEENALASVKPKESKGSVTNKVGAAMSAEPVVPADLPAVWKEIKRVEARKFPEADGVILRRRLSYTLGSNPTIAAEHEQFIQVLTPEGKRFGDFDISYSPPFEDITFLDCEVLRPDGKLVRLDPDAIREGREQSVGDYQRAQRKFFSLPGVVPGSVLHVHYRTTWKTFPLPNVSLEIPIGEELAAVEATLQVSVPKEAPFHFALEQITAADPAIKQTTYGTTYSWRFENLPAQEHEILVSPGSRSRLQISTFPDWAAFAEWYGRISQLTDEVTPEIAAKAKELTREAKEDRDKVLAVYNYVTRLRYVAVPMGVNSFRPHSAANVLQNEYGDCKDKANLFNALLHSLGITAHLVLVPRFSQARDEMPGLAFNHAISRVTLGGEALWVDTTDDVCRFGMLPPGDPGRKVLVIDGRSSTLTGLPAADPREHVLKVHGEVDCSGAIDAMPINLDATASGYPDYELRATARETKAHATRLPLLAAKFHPVAGSFALESQRSTSVAALNEDFAWHATGNCVGLFSAASGGGLLRAPFWLPDEWDLALHHRKAGLYLNQGYPLTLEEEFEFTLPANMQLGALPGVREKTTTPLRWRIEWTKISDGKLVARMRAELVRGEMSSAETLALQKQLREFLGALAAGAGLAVPAQEK
ncbi:MAG: DUF3857 domain-containing protein [Verrucomicrobia bacterium]|nr:DUF3857 domain-containing protein [Verrucomicrobiota bacterium]